MAKSKEKIAGELADIEEARLRGELDKEEAKTLSEQIVLPPPAQSEELTKDVPLVIDFNYHGLSDEDRVSQAAKDMERIYSDDEPPRMPSIMPRFVKAYLWNTPDYYKPGYSQAGFPAAAVLMDDVSFKHPNNLFVPAKLNAQIVGPSGVGKNGLPYIFNAMLMELMAESFSNMEREVKVKEHNNLLASTAKRMAQPDNLVQRIVFPNTTTPALANQMKQNKGLPCFMEAKEIEDLYCFKNGAGGISPLVLMREADDPDGRLRQRRVGEKSVTVDVPLFLNYCVSTTPDGANDFFKRDMVKGALNRQEVAFIPDQPIGEEEGKYKPYDDSYTKRLKPFIDNLRKAREHADEKGYIVCKRAITLHKELKEECAAYVHQTFDRTWDNLTHRGLTHAFLKACVLYVANGCKWEPAIDSFIRWGFHYCLWSKLHVFGDKIREAEKKVKYSKPGKPNLLLLIKGNVFTLDEAMYMRKNQGMNDSIKATKNMLSVWVSRNWIKRLPDNRFEKIEYKL